MEDKIEDNKEKEEKEETKERENQKRQRIISGDVSKQHFMHY